MNSFFVRAFLLLSTLFGVARQPTSNAAWTNVSGWKLENNNYRFSAENVDLWEDCARSPDGYIGFPQIILGVQELVVDGRVVASTGDSTFRRSSPFYNRGNVSCRVIPQHSKIVWTATSSTAFFARFDRYPSLSFQKDVAFFLDVGINVIVVGALIILSLFSFFIFRGKVPRALYIPLIFGSLSWAIYAAMTSADFFGLNLSTLTAQKIGETFVCLGAYFYFSFFERFKYLSRMEFNLFNWSSFVGVALILVGSTGDAVQFGMSIAIPATLLCFAMILYRAISEIQKQGLTHYSLLGLGSIFSFVIVGTNDLLHVNGIIPGFMILPVGAVSGVFFLTTAVNREIEKTYVERDSLLAELEMKVEENTLHLTEALQSLKKSQADLIQSARLASLGTLSAGIAHEINNSINFVNGALIPLERRIMKYVDEAERPLIEKLFAAIKEGTALTVEIVRSLRSFTGMNQAKVAEVRLYEVVRSVLTILRNRTKDLKVNLLVPEDITFVGHQVGINQILMNLISNACDAVVSHVGEITITASFQETNVILEVADNGAGMTKDVAARIFDPFYTTKDVGKGTGLGMHIVRGEVDRHHGQIEVTSEPGAGTTIRITFPRNLDVLYQNEVAA